MSLLTAWRRRRDRRMRRVLRPVAANEGELRLVAANAGEFHTAQQLHEPKPFTVGDLRAALDRIHCILRLVEDAITARTTREDG